MPDRKDRIEKMCKRALVETDPRRLLELSNQINDILSSIIDDVGKVRKTFPVWLKAPQGGTAAFARYCRLKTRSRSTNASRLCHSKLQHATSRFGGSDGYDCDSDHDSISFWNNPAKAGLTSAKVLQLRVVCRKRDKQRRSGLSVQ